MKKLAEGDKIFAVAGFIETMLSLGVTKEELKSLLHPEVIDGIIKLVEDKRSERI